MLGVPASSVSRQSVGNIAPVTIDGANRFSDFAIDEKGTLSGLMAGARRPLARLALAIFPASERMERVDDTTLAATRSSGKPHLFYPADPNVGALQPHALENALVDLEGDLARLWRLRRQGDVCAAQVHASDECLREALGLVK